MTDTNTQIKNLLTELSTRHSKWENARETQNDELYSLLAEAMNFVQVFEEHGAEKKIKFLLNDCGIQYSSKSSLELKVAKLALTQNSKRASAYAKVFTTAKADGIAPSELKVWIKGKGGIEKIRLSSSNGKKIDEYFTEGKSNIENATALGKVELLPNCWTVSGVT